MYKDKAKQREANRLAAKRYRSRRKGMMEGGSQTKETIIPCNTPDVIPDKYELGIKKLAEDFIAASEPKPQSDNPMKVGYVPPIE